jgi:hypothetical protein
LPEKNSLIAADARRVEESFRARLAGFAAGTDHLKEPKKVREARSSRTGKAAKRNNRRRPDGIDKAALAFPEPRRVRDREHVKSVAQHPCLVCGRKPADAHHLRFAQSRALGRKVSDEFTVPLCRGHHREVHRCGDEAAWWSKAKIDPIVTARMLWLETHPLASGRNPTGSEDPPLAPTSAPI